MIAAKNNDLIILQTLLSCEKIFILSKDDLGMSCKNYATDKTCL